jgi:hypothetical protein
MKTMFITHTATPMTRPAVLPEVRAAVQDLGSREQLEVEQSPMEFAYLLEPPPGVQGMEETVVQQLPRPGRAQSEPLLK